MIEIHNQDNVFLGKYKLHKDKVDLGFRYRWYDENVEVAEFKVFDWWDGLNVCDLEIFNQYKGKGLSYQLLDVATNELCVKNVALRSECVS